MKRLFLAAVGLFFVGSLPLFLGEKAPSPRKGREALSRNRPLRPLGKNLERTLSEESTAMDFSLVAKWAKSPLRHEARIFRLAVSAVRVSPEEESRFVHENALRLYAADVLNKEILKGNLPRSVLFELLRHSQNAAVKTFVQQVLNYRPDRSYSDDLIFALARETL
jgi:hypothetical protein